MSSKKEYELTPGAPTDTSGMGDALVDPTAPFGIAGGATAFYRLQLYRRMKKKAFIFPRYNILSNDPFVRVSKSKVYILLEFISYAFIMIFSPITTIIWFFIKDRDQIKQALLLLLLLAFQIPRLLFFFQQPINHFDDNPMAHIVVLNMWYSLLAGFIFSVVEYRYKKKPNEGFRLRNREDMLYMFDDRDHPLEDTRGDIISILLNRLVPAVFFAIVKTGALVWRIRGGQKTYLKGKEMILLADYVFLNIALGLLCLSWISILNIRLRREKRITQEITMVGKYEDKVNCINFLHIDTVITWNEERTAALHGHSRAFEATMITCLLFHLAVCIFVVTLDLNNTPILPDLLQEKGIAVTGMIDVVLFGYTLASGLFVAFEINYAFEQQLRNLIIMKRVCENLLNLAFQKVDLRKIMHEDNGKALHSMYTDEMKLMIFALNDSLDKMKVKPDYDIKKYLKRNGKQIDSCMGQIRQGREFNTVMLFGVLIVNLPWIRSISISLSIAVVVNAVRYYMSYLSELKKAEKAAEKEALNAENGELG